MHSEKLVLRVLLQVGPVSNGYFIFFSNGIFSSTVPIVDFVAAFGTTTCVQINFSVLVMQFVYRYLYICREGYSSAGILRIRVDKA